MLIKMADSTRKMLKKEKYFAECEPLDVERKSIEKNNVVKKIKSFYYQDNIYRIFTGMKDV